MAESDVRITSAWLWQLVRYFAGTRQICDVCTEPSNPLGAPRFITAEQNAHTTQWARNLGELRNWLYWGNVPYSRGQVQEFAETFVENARMGLECLMLTQNDSSTGWHKYLRANVDARCALDRRVIFLEPAGDGVFRPCAGGAKFASCLWYWGPRRQRFHSFWAEHGEVIAGLGPQEEI